MREFTVRRPSLSPVEAGDLIAFLYALKYFDPAHYAGAGKKGRDLATEKGCLAATRSTPKKSRRRFLA